MELADLKLYVFNTELRLKNFLDLHNFVLDLKPAMARRTRRRLLDEQTENVEKSLMEKEICGKFV